MKFSILVPVYNVEKYVDECIQSVLIQTFKDYELILVDDGSTDSSGKICNDYASKYSKIRVFHKPNAGLLHTRRYGLSKARGDWYIFLDSDDLLDRNALEIINRYTDKSDCIIYGYEKILNGKTIYREHEEKTEIISDKRELFRKIFVTSDCNALWRKAVKATKVGNIDYSDYYHINLGEDLLQSIEILENCGVFTFIPDVLYKYRVNPKSITQSIEYKNYSIDFTVRIKVLDLIQRTKVFLEEDYDVYRDRCLDIGLFENLVIIANLKTTLRNKYQLCSQLKKTQYYKKFLSKGYSKGYKRWKRKLVFKLFQMHQYLILLAILKKK